MTSDGRRMSNSTIRMPASVPMMAGVRRKCRKVLAEKPPDSPDQRTKDTPPSCMNEVLTTQ